LGVAWAVQTAHQKITEAGTLSFVPVATQSKIVRHAQSSPFVTVNSIGRSMNLSPLILIGLLLATTAFGQLSTRNPLDELRDQVVQVLADAGVPFTTDQEKGLALLIEEQRQASEDLFGQIMDFTSGVPQGQERDRALAGIQWINDEFKKKLPTFLTGPQQAAWEEYESSTPVLEAGIESARSGSAARTEQIQQIRINNNPFTSEDPNYGGGNFQGGNNNNFGGNFQGGNNNQNNNTQNNNNQNRGNFQGGNNRGNERTEIIQRGGTGAFHGNFQAIFQDETLNARNPFAENKPPYNERTINGNFNGPLIRNRLTIDFGFNDNRQENVGTVKALTLEGPYSLGVTRPNVNRNLNGRAILQLSDSNSLHFGGRHFTSNRKNQDVGNFILPERGIDGENGNNNLELRQITVLSPRSVYETRFTLQTNRNNFKPINVAEAITVLDAFSSGGGQQSNENNGRTYDFGNLLYYTGEKVTLKAGTEGRYLRRRSLQESNFTGEFTFSDLESYRIGKPLKYKITKGDPLVDMNQLELGFFVQNDVKLSNRFTVMLGARYDTQTNLSDKNNLDPRLGFAYAIGGSTVIRGGAGTFHQRLFDGAVQQLMRLDGKRQYEILIDNPGWPDPFVAGSVRNTASRRVRAPDLVAPYNVVSSISLERTLPSNLFVSVTAEYYRGLHLFRSRNLNAPLPGTGIKPFPDDGHIYQMESTGKLTYKSLRFAMRQRFSIFNITGSYAFASAYGDTDQQFTLPANNYDLKAEWGRANFVEKHSFNTAINARMPLDVYVTTNISANTGNPYNITTGKDDNGDGQTNDRPAGIARNSADGPRYFNVGFNFSKAFSLGGSSGSGGPNGRGGEGGGGSQLSVFVNLNNALNMTNPGTPSGVMTSTFFGTSTSAATGPREIEAGMRYQF
jgi:hypothetical protein